MNIHEPSRNITTHYPQLLVESLPILQPLFNRHSAIIPFTALHKNMFHFAFTDLRKSLERLVRGLSRAREHKRSRTLVTVANWPRASDCRLCVCNSGFLLVVVLLLTMVVGYSMLVGHCCRLLLASTVSRKSSHQPVG